MKTFALVLALSCSAFAGEYAVLSSGSRLYADRHEVNGPVVRLFSKAGFTELPAASVVSFEIEEYVPPPPAAPIPPQPVSVAPPKPSPQELVQQAAKKHGLPPAFVQSVARAESGYRVHAVSPKGAIGLMQLMPPTAQALGADPRVPAENVDAGAQYLRDLLLKYKYQPELALAAYNAGPGAVDRYRGVPPYRETQAYVDRVLRNYHKLQKQ